MVKSAAKRQLVVTTSGLPPLRAGKVYQLWLIGTHGNKIRSEGLLAAPHNGHTAPVLISGLLAGDILGVSVQQAGGSIQPTIPAVIVEIPTS
jgi:anti-sigma-K factor RskA